MHTPPRRHSSALIALAVAATTALAGLIAAPSASAVATVTDTAMCNTQTLTPVSLAVGESLEVTVGTGSNCASLQLFNSALQHGSIDINGGPITSPGTVAVADGNVVTFVATSAGTVALNFIAGLDYSLFMITITGGGSSDDTATTEPVAAPATMGLALGDNATCTGGSPTGITGEWMTLPAAGDCHNTATPTATLLGWSTSADFPVAIAQRQSANNWGAYELTDADGVVTAIYIPAGWATFVTGSTNLYPIWNK